MALTLPVAQTAQASATVMSPWPHPISRTVLPSRKFFAVSRLPNQACKILRRCCVCEIAMRWASDFGDREGFVCWISEVARSFISKVNLFDIVGKSW